MTETMPSRVPWPPLIYLVAIVAGIALTAVYPLPWIGEPMSDMLFVIGGLVGAAAIYLFVMSVRAMRKARTTVMPTKAAEHLVTSGPFALSRNPIYVGDTMLTIAIGLVTGSLWFILLAIIAAFLTTRLAILPEERFLAARFGKKYRDYTTKVRRWL